jgi:hypothetical protein
MAGQLQFQGSVTAGPVSTGDPTAFPGGTDIIQIVTTPNPKSYAKHEHKSIDYGNVIGQALDFTGIAASFVYLRCNKAITISINGGTALPLYGVLAIEAPPATPITAITVTTTEPTQLEYLIAGA